MGLPLDQVYLAFRSLTSRSGRYRAGWGQRMHWGWEYFGESKSNPSSNRLKLLLGQRLFNG